MTDLDGQNNENKALGNKASAVKKFVVAIAEKNTEYFEGLSEKERFEVINKLIAEYKDEECGKLSFHKKCKCFKHLLVVLITLVVAFPVIFFAVNQSLKVSIKQYCQISNDFEKIYNDDTIDQSTIDKMNYEVVEK